MVTPEIQPLAKNLVAERASVVLTRMAQKGSKKGVERAALVDTLAKFALAKDAPIKR